MRFCEVDVFTTGPFLGNPLAVIDCRDEVLDDELMRRLAAWTGFSETTFLLPPTDPAADYRVRILTPSTEYPFAGHPTLGTARAFLHWGGAPRNPSELVQECGVGLVRVRVRDDQLAFATPPRFRTGALDEADLAAVCEALRISPDEVVAHAWGCNGPDWRLVQLRDADAVRNLRPQPVRGDLRIGLVGLEPTGAPSAYEVRALGPTHEDPVTGSLNGALAQWLRERGQVPEQYVATQGSQVGRAGEVSVHDDGAATWIGGRAVVVVDGQLLTPGVR